MKTLFTIMVLLLSTTSFAGEGREVGLSADRIELRNDIKKDSQASASEKTESSCKSDAFQNRTVRC